MPQKDTFDREDLKSYQDANEGDHDSGKNVSRAEHQARNDYQGDGEPFGPLGKRDPDDKEGVPSRRDFDESNQ